jgi:hypothetical protein
MPRAGVFFLSIVLIALGALAYGGLRALYNWRVLPTLLQNQAIQSKHLSLYSEDVAYVEKFGFLKELEENHQKAESNAGLVLNSKLFWQPLDHPNKTRTEPVIPIDVREDLMRLRTNWIRQSSRVKRMKANLDFFNGLENYDHWDIEIKSPISDLIDQGVFVPPPRLPIPEVSDLLAAVKLRLMRANLQEDYALALKDVRQFARLLLTTENTQLVIAGLAVLDHERHAYRYYVDEKSFPPDKWQPVDRNFTRRARRAILATRGYLHLWTKPAILEQVFLSGRTPIGFCSAANEAFPFEESIRPLLEPRLPFEQSFREAYARLDRIFAKAKRICRLRYLNRLMKNDHFASVIPGPFLLNRLPYSRRVFGMKINVSNFSGFDSYNQSSAGMMPMGN